MGRLTRFLRRNFLRRGQVGPAGAFRTSTDVLDHYVAAVPSAQTAVDAVPGWLGSMPPEVDVVAGALAFWADPRIACLLESFAVEGRHVLELGPLEGFHTHMLHKAGAASIEAIEANALAYVRCLITKETLRLDRARFHLGDFMKWLETIDKHYDLVVASGVLYHSHDPVRLIELMCEHSDAVYLWTHYFDDVAMPPGDLRRVPFSEKIETRECRGVTARLHERSYFKAWRDPAFCGGIQDRHFWVDRQDILRLLEALGFEVVMIADEEPDHRNGPCFSLLATRRATVEPAADADVPKETQIENIVPPEAADAGESTVALSSAPAEA